MIAEASGRNEIIWLMSGEAGGEGGELGAVDWQRRKASSPSSRSEIKQGAEPSDYQPSPCRSVVSPQPHP